MSYYHDNTCECCDDDFNCDGVIDVCDSLIYIHWIEEGKPDDVDTFNETFQSIGYNCQDSVCKLPRMTCSDYTESECLTELDAWVHYAYTQMGGSNRYGDNPNVDNSPHEGDSPLKILSAVNAHYNDIAPKDLLPTGPTVIGHLPKLPCEYDCRDALSISTECNQETGDLKIIVENDGCKVLLEYFKLIVIYDAVIYEYVFTELSWTEDKDPSLWTDDCGSRWLLSSGIIHTEIPCDKTSNRDETDDVYAEIELESSLKVYSAYGITCESIHQDTNEPLQYSTLIHEESLEECCPTPTPTPTPPTYTPTPSPTPTPNALKDKIRASVPLFTPVP